jgi:hypothetical protein
MSEPLRVPDTLVETLKSFLASTKRCEVVRSGPREPISEWVRVNVLMRVGFTCKWCGASGSHTQLHIDHIVPWSAGGTVASGNLRILCQTCILQRSNLQTDADYARALLITNGCGTCCADFYGDDRDIGEVAIWCAWCRATGLVNQDTFDHYRDEQINHMGLASPGYPFMTAAERRNVEREVS